MTGPRCTDDYLDHFRLRVLQDALAEATASYWLRRARDFDNARHRPGDFPGLVDVGQIEANNRTLAAKAQACRNRAAVALLPDDHLADQAAAALREAS